MKGFFRVFWTCIFLVFLSVSSVYAVKLDVVINENSSITKLLTGQYSLDVVGEVVIKNPSYQSTIYDFYIPFYFDSLVGINKLSVHSTSDRFKFSYNRVKGSFIYPNETVKVGYRIYGLVNDDIFELSEDANKSIFEYYTKDYDFLSKTLIDLEKIQREGYVYLQNGSLASTPTSNVTGRVVAPVIKNPTDFDYFVRELKVYKAEVSDPVYDDGKLVDEAFNLSIVPKGFLDLSFRDLDGDDFSVYWFSAQVVTKYNLTSNFRKLFTVQTPPSAGGSSSGGGGGGGGGSSKKDKVEDDEEEINETDVIEIGDKSIFQNEGFDSILFKKTVDKNLVRVGEKFEVTLKIANVNEFDFENLVVEDYIPDGYVISKISDDLVLRNGSYMKFEVDRVLAYGTYVVSYVLENKDALRGISYLNPATLTYEGDSKDSEGVLIVNDILPDKKVFVQKELENVDDRFVRVKIKIKNLGGIVLEDVLVTDEIDPDVIIKDISKVFQKKGVWQVSSLNPGEEWQVDYLIEKNDLLNSIPNVFGVDSSDVYGTIMVSEEVVVNYEDGPKTAEKVGLVLALILLILYVLF